MSRPSPHSARCPVACGRAGWWSGLGMLLVSLLLASAAPAQVLIREVISREVTVYVGLTQTPEIKELVSREVEVLVHSGRDIASAEIISREVSVTVDAAGAPPPVTGFLFTMSPTGDSVSLDWTSYNPWAVGDIHHFEIYIADSPFSDVSGLTPVLTVGGETVKATISGLTTFRDHYISIVAVDALGNRNPVVTNKGAYVISPEVISREVTVMNGQDPPEPPLTVDPVVLDQSGFETPTTSNNLRWSVMTEAQRTALGWTGAGNTGWGGPCLFRNGSSWGFATVPEGVQGIVLQADTSISRSVNFPEAGTYQISWQAASRGGQMNPYVLRLDGATVSTSFSTSNTAWQAASWVLTIPSAGVHALTFAATTAAGTDRSVGLDQVRIQRVTGQETRPTPGMRELVSREVVVEVTGAVPPVVTGVKTTISPTGDSMTLDWTAYNPWAVGTVDYFEIYVADAPFSDVSGMSPWTTVGGETVTATLTGLNRFRDHSVAVVAIDALGRRNTAVTTVSAYVVSPEVISREVTVNVGEEPLVPLYKELVSREISIMVADGTTPAAVTGIGSGFSAEASASLFGAIDVDWTSYNELAQHDVTRYRVYVANSYFDDVTGMEPFLLLQAGCQKATIDSFASASVFFVAVVAEDSSGNFNPVVRSHLVQASYIPYFSFLNGVEPVTVHEGEVANIPVNVEGLTRTAHYQLVPGSAHKFDGTTGDYVDAAEPLEFRDNPSTHVLEANLQVPIIRDSVPEADEEFVVRIVNPHGGSNTVITSIRVIIEDDIPTKANPTAVWHPEIQMLPGAPSLVNHQLGVELSTQVPTVSGAQWRLVGEPFWRDPGPTQLVSQLADGVHFVEYKPVAGYGPPVSSVAGSYPAVWEFFANSAAPHLFSINYPTLATPQSGSLRVNLLPDGLASAPGEAARAQWRMVGETAWRNSGTSLTLPIGKHLIEFKDSVAGHHAPVPRTAFVEAGVQAIIECEYQVAEASPINVETLAFGGSPGSGQVDEAPQTFTGQIETSIGYGSGVAVTAHTVLTAARVVFDPNRLAGARDITWHRQRHADYAFGEDPQDYRIAPAQYPRGFKLLTSYASMRSEEVSADSHPLPGQAQSDQQDVAVLYFIGLSDSSSTARGGFSGFLADFSMEARPNPWLTGTLEKRLCGYPMSGIPWENRGLMHAAGPLATGCESFAGQLYRSQDISGRPGMEGAPLFVKHSNGKFYPAAIYLGQNGGSIFRAFDLYVAAAIYKAEAETVVTVGSAGLSYGGYKTPWTDDDTSVGFLYVDFVPSWGSWQIFDPSDPDPTHFLIDWMAPGVRVPVLTGNYGIRYQVITGYSPPTPQQVLTSAGFTSFPAEPVVYRQTYADWAASQSRFSSADLANPLISGPEASLNGLPNLIAFAFGLEPGSTQRPVARPEDSQPGLPRVMIDAATHPPTIAVDFLRRKATLVPELAYIIEFADSPAGPWDKVEETIPETTTINEEWDHVHLTSAPVASAGRKFARVRVERSSP